MTPRRKVWMSTVLALFVVLTSSLFQTLSASANVQGNRSTTTPIKHVIVIVGENHTFDNVFGVFQPVKGQKVNNLLSEGIVTCQGAGPHVGKATQQQATDTGTCSLSPQKTGPYTPLPQPNTTYAQGQPPNVPDARFPANLPNAPYQITKYVPYQNSYVGDPLHRFYQMWQQQDKGKNDLYTWVPNTAGDDNGANPPLPIHQGALDMGYYNMCAGDAPNFNFIGNNYAISDNYHQSVMGGTGANHIMLGTGDAAYYQDAHGNPTTPPLNQIENPNPKPGTNNNYTQDGYAGGSYSNCSDPGQPGVGPILQYLHSLPYQPFRKGDCAPGAYYLLNNYLPGYTPSGQLTTGTPFVVPPQTSRTIADSLSAHNVSWKYYGQGYNGGEGVPKFLPPLAPLPILPPTNISSPTK